ncbi:MarR family transcriptional regulator [Paenarthrobacter sp. Z7-10]|uniref:MarR family winged helix-turn-helix transcriptional regulator n=1 Tax=Paenarthrobacter sp. Z7-10 TaxID=2787635 RepID=UPI0022A8FAED|nr:MarR family transcriptional regulator [Paenarthrobacter sp. Z7-10]MCZ2404962.1 MarR family transcriptional regulator [Paenarthrobacter sp. Z7-10]
MLKIRDDEGHDVPLTEVITALSAIGKNLLDGLTLALSEEDTTAEQWRVLHLVSKLGSPTMGELAALSGMANASLSRVIDALEDAASVFRLPSPEDRRRITVQLSDHGAARLNRMENLVSAWEALTRVRLGPDTVDALTHAMRLAGEGDRGHQSSHSSVAAEPAHAHDCQPASPSR